MKINCNLFSQLFIAAQVRDTRLGEFVAHENHPLPPALPLHGKVQLLSTKHELLQCNEPHFQQETPSYFDAKVFDGAAIVHSFHSTTQKRSVNTVTLSSLPGLKDNYMAVLGLTSSGTPTCRKVLPMYFAGVLQDATNKEELLSTCR